MSNSATLNIWGKPRPQLDDSGVGPFFRSKLDIQNSESLVNKALLPTLWASQQVTGLLTRSKQQNDEMSHAFVWFGAVLGDKLADIARLIGKINFSNPNTPDDLLGGKKKARAGTRSQARNNTIKSAGRSAFGKAAIITAISGFMLNDLFAEGKIPEHLRPIEKPQLAPGEKLVIDGLEVDTEAASDLSRTMSEMKASLLLNMSKVGKAGVDALQNGFTKTKDFAINYGGELVSMVKSAFDGYIGLINGIKNYVAEGVKIGYNKIIETKDKVIAYLTEFDPLGYFGEVLENTKLLFLRLKNKLGYAWDWIAEKLDFSGTWEGSGKNFTTNSNVPANVGVSGSANSGYSGGGSSGGGGASAGYSSDGTSSGPYATPNSGNGRSSPNSGTTSSSGASARQSQPTYSGGTVAPGEETSGTWNKRADVPVDSRPASVRYNNPGAAYPRKRDEKFGLEGYGVIGGGHKIGKFPTVVHGAASNMDLWDKNYAGLTLQQAIVKWRGGNGSLRVPQGFDPNHILTKEDLNNKEFMISFFKGMAKHEAGRKTAITDEQWNQAFDMFQAGGVTEYKKQNPDFMPTPLTPVTPSIEPASPLVNSPSSNPTSPSVPAPVTSGIAPSQSVATPSQAPNSVTSSPNSAVTGENRVYERQNQLAGIRKLDIKPGLKEVLQYAAEDSGVEVEIYSGGQHERGHGPRTGSTRHDHGNSADLKLYVRDENGKRRLLSANNPKDREIMGGFIESSRKMGAQGIGHGNSYMGPSSLHVGTVRNDVANEGNERESMWGSAYSGGPAAPDWARNSFGRGAEQSKSFSMKAERERRQKLKDEALKRKYENQNVFGEPITEPHFKPNQPELANPPTVNAPELNTKKPAESVPSVNNAPSDTTIINNQAKNTRQDKVYMDSDGIRLFSTEDLA